VYDNTIPENSHINDDEAMGKYIIILIFLFIYICYYIYINNYIIYIYIIFKDTDTSDTSNNDMEKTINTILNILNDYILDIDHSSRNLKNQVCYK